MDNQWVQQRAAFDREDLAHADLIERITREAIDSLGGHADDFVAAQQFSTVS